MTNTDLFIEKFLKFDLQIREKEGVNDQLYDELLTLLHLMSIEYAHQDVIPKKLADVFLDMWGALTSSAEMYDAGMRDEIHHIADNLCNKARNIVCS